MPMRTSPPVMAQCFAPAVQCSASALAATPRTSATTAGGGQAAESVPARPAAANVRGAIWRWEQARNVSMATGHSPSTCP
jgi:hypothetical protein